MELISSWEQGGFLEDAAILKGRRKQEIRTSSCSTYSSSASTIRNTRLKILTSFKRSNIQLRGKSLSHQFRFRMLSACGELMYCSTICFHRRRQSQPRKKLWTFFILAMSGSSLSLSYSDGKLKNDMDEVKRKNSVSYLFRLRYCFWGITLHSFFRVKS